MKTIQGSFAILSILILTACATTYSMPPEPASENAPASSGDREPGTIVVRRDLVFVGSAGLLDPIPVPADAAAATERDANVATVDRSSSGCDTRAGGVEVANGTEFPVTLTVDGVAVVLLGSAEIRRFIAPHTTAYLCLDPARPHAFEGFAIKRFGERLYAIPNTFREDVAAGANGPVAVRVNYERIAAAR